jgi:hypothetical protein
LIKESLSRGSIVFSRGSIVFSRGRHRSFAKLRGDIAMSIVEAECSALSMAMRGLLPLRELLMTLATSIGAEASHQTSFKTTFREDNAGAFRSVNPSIDQSINSFNQTVSIPFSLSISLQCQSVYCSSTPNLLYCYQAYSVNQFIAVLLPTCSTVIKSSLRFQSVIKSTVSISSTKREAEVLVCFVRYHRGYRS